MNVLFSMVSMCPSTGSGVWNTAFLARSSERTYYTVLSACAVSGAGNAAFVARSLLKLYKERRKVIAKGQVLMLRLLHL